MSKLVEKIEQLKALLGNVVNGVSEVSQAAGEQEKTQDERYNTLSELSLMRDRKRRDEISSLEQKIDNLALQIESKVEFGFGAVESLKERISSVESKILHISSPIDPKPIDPKPVPNLIIPEGSILIPLESTEVANISRTDSLVSCGIPIAEELNVTDISRLVLIRQGREQIQEGTHIIPDILISADFRPTAYWNTDNNPNGIMLVQVSFIDSFEAGEKKNYQVVILPQDSAPLDPDISLVRVKPFIQNLNPSFGYLDTIHDKVSNTVMVDTGAAKFYISPKGVFESIEQDEKVILSNGITSITIDGQSGTFSNTNIRRMEIEYLGPIVCNILVETVTESLTLGTQSDGKKPARLSTIRRYQFVRGSSIAIVQNILKWEGTKNGNSYQMSDYKTLNSVVGTLWQDRLKLVESSSDFVEFIGEDGEPESWSGFDIIAERQFLRESRKQLRSAAIILDGEKLRTDNVAHGILKTEQVIVGLQNMNQHEPQALVYDSVSGLLDLNYANDKFHLALRQGVCVTSMIGLVEGKSLQQYWADLNHPMRIFPSDSSYFNVSAFGAVPSLSVEGPVIDANYRDTLLQVCRKTEELISRDGLYGLMTHAWWPRSWDNDWIESGIEEKWDTLFASTSFTDYYSVTRSAVTLSLMTKDSKWLDDLAFPSALRMLWTQIWHTAPEDPNTKSGWAPSGYGAGRSDLNSSHSYYENLFLYYLLTGDTLVLDTLSRGEAGMIQELSNQGLSGRFAHQRLRAQRFLSHCAKTEEQREFFRNSWLMFVDRAIKDHYVEGTYEGRSVAFWTEAKKKVGENNTGGLYTLGIWDLESLWYLLDYWRNNDSISDFNLGQLANKFILLVKTIQLYGPILASGDGSVSKTSLWARAFKFNWNGQEGNSSLITKLTTHPEKADGHPYLYEGDIPGMCASWARAASLSNDPEYDSYV